MQHTVFILKKKYDMVCYKLHLNTNPILEIELKLFTKWNSVHGVIIHTYQLADLGLARVSVQIVFLSAKRRSIKKASSPLPPENPLGIWTFKDWLIQIPVSRGQNCVQTPYLSAWFDSQFFCKRQDQRPRLSCRPFSSEPSACESKLFTFKQLHVKR